jgi:hypothetical protein
LRRACGDYVPGLLRGEERRREVDREGVVRLPVTEDRLDADGGG